MTFKKKYLVALLVPFLWAFSTGSVEYKVKLAFIEKFTHYIDWPSPRPNSAEFVVGIYGEDRFSEYISDYISSDLFHGKPLKIVLLKTAIDINKNMSVVFLGKDKKLALDSIVQRAKLNSCLTISEITGAAKKGVMINFVEIDNSIKFEINNKVMKQSGFKTSSHLLKLAKIVDP